MNRLAIIAVTCCLGLVLTACGEQDTVKPTVVKPNAAAPANHAEHKDAVKTENGESH